MIIVQTNQNLFNDLLLKYEFRINYLNHAFYINKFRVIQSHVNLITISVTIIVPFKMF